MQMEFKNISVPLFCRIYCREYEYIVHDFMERNGSFSDFDVFFVGKQ